MLGSGMSGRLGSDGVDTGGGGGSGVVVVVSCGVVVVAASDVACGLRDGACCAEVVSGFVVGRIGAWGADATVKGFGLAGALRGGAVCDSVGRLLDVVDRLGAGAERTERREVRRTGCATGFAAWTATAGTACGWGCGCSASST